MFLSIFLLGVLSVTSTKIPDTSFNLSLGKIEIHVPVSVKAFSIDGKAKELKGSATLNAKKQVTGIHIVIPVDSLTTDMSLRDKHMREKIFKNGESTPDIQFDAKDLHCAPPSCEIEGTLSFAGKNAKFPTTLQVKIDGKQLALNGEGDVRLADYQIPAPEQLGVKVLDPIHLKFSVKAN